MATITTTAPARTVKAKINYYPPDGPRVFYPGTAGYQKRNFDTKSVEINDVRGAEEQFTLDKNGFQVVTSPWTEIGVNDDKEKVESIVYPETVDMLKKITGASHIVPFSQQIRRATAEELKASADGLKDSDTLKGTGPTRFAHCDNSEAGALTVLKAVMPDYEDRIKHRWAIMNTWRGLRPVTRDPLALLDARTVDPSEMVGVLALFPKKGGAGAFDGAYDAGDGYETAQIKDDKGAHKWYYASNLKTDEALVFKQFDSKKDGRARQVPHSAFESELDEGPPRESIEVRALLFWEDESTE